MVHDRLVEDDGRTARLAEPVSPGQGTWRINPDGTMDTSWRLNPKARWHDGTSFTAGDVLFAFEASKDPQSTPPDGNAQRLMVAASAPDPTTVVIHWSEVYVNANRGLNLTPLPRHLLEDVYRADREAFFNSPRLNTEFVGLGPFGMSRWEPGAFIEFTAFEDYYLGRPKLDRVILRFIPDPNTLIANILSDNLDVVLANAIDTDLGLAAEVEQRWLGTTNRVIYQTGGGVNRMEIQLRPEFALPKNGLPNRTVRQAMYHAADRATFNEIVNLNKVEIADSWFPRNDPLRPKVESALPQYPFDLARAQRLLADAGWTRGADGALVHGTSGERFEIALHGPVGTKTEKSLNVIAEGWKSVGMQITFNIIPNSIYNDLDYRSHLSGSGLSSVAADGFYGGRGYIHSRFISSPANRWTGANRSGYSNPKVDAIIDKLAVTIDEAERVPLHRELLTEAWTDVPFIPLNFGASPTMHLGRVKGIPASGDGSVTVNIHEWTVEPAGR